MSKQEEVDEAYARLHHLVDRYMDRLKRNLHLRIDGGREQYKGAWVGMPLSELRNMLNEEEEDVIIYRMMVEIREGKS